MTAVPDGFHEVRRQRHDPSSCGLALMGWRELCDCPYETVVERVPDYSKGVVIPVSELLAPSNWDVVARRFAALHDAFMRALLRP